MLLNIIDFIKALKYIKQFIEWFDLYIIKKKGNAKVDKLTEANSKVDEANKINDDIERLKQKQEAASNAEKAISGND